MAPAQPTVYIILDNVARTYAQSKSYELYHLFEQLVYAIGCSEYIVRYCDLTTVKMFMSLMDSKDSVEPSFLYQAFKSADNDKIDYFLSREDSQEFMQKYGWVTRHMDRQLSNVMSNLSVKDYVVV